MELTNVKGIGKKTIEKFHKLGIQSVEDLLQFYPYRYEVLKRTDMETVQDQEKVMIDGTVASDPRVFYLHRSMNKMTFQLETKTQIYQVVIFNRSYLKAHLPLTTNVIIIGKYDQKRHSITASELQFGVLPDHPTTVPIYHLTEGVSEKQLRQAIDASFILCKEVEDLIPKEYQEKYHFLPKISCIKEIHHTTTDAHLHHALARLKYEELFSYMLKLNCLKKENKQGSSLKRRHHDIEYQQLLDVLPFTLTKDQATCMEQIQSDFISHQRMNRLIQGDVGSGKTVLAILSIYLNYLDGYQSAFMAPTEILATQHYENMKQLLEPFGIRIEKLTGRCTKKEKQAIYEQLNAGIIDVVVGTHALISEEVVYQNLGLVITDEQHRFGVNQRGNLKNKGRMPDILYMSATPIPRTYALTLYGDMDISNIYTVPSGKKPIITILKKEHEMKDVLECMYQELKQHHQIYVIAPLIEESDKIDLTNVYQLEENMTKAFGKIVKIGLLHGKMKAEEKEQVMHQFQKNEIQILISTTVIEVGVDVKNATMIVIFDAYRFGLATLHQLRGRVGRNQLQSYAILISNQESERLSILTKTCDGFKISEEDFRLRGSGDLFGQRQSGDMVFRLANLKQDLKIALLAKKDSEEYLENNNEFIINSQKIHYLD